MAKSPDGKPVKCPDPKDLEKLPARLEVKFKKKMVKGTKRWVAYCTDKGGDNDPAAHPCEIVAFEIPQALLDVFFVEFHDVDDLFETRTWVWQKAGGGLVVAYRVRADANGDKCYAITLRRKDDLSKTEDVWSPMGKGPCGKSRPASVEDIKKCWQTVQEYLEGQGPERGLECMNLIKNFVSGNGGDREAVKNCLQGLRAMLDELPPNVSECVERLLRFLAAQDPPRVRIPPN